MQDVELVISQQGSLEQEKVYKNGAQKNVHAVIKNIPFQFELTTDTPTFSFHKAPPIEARLLYDCLGEEKTVDFVKSSPMEYACKISTKGESVTVDMKLAVLSSQHEDMFFIVKFSFKGTDVTVLSDPIKVVSKPAQLKKNRDGLRRGTKRTFNDTLKETLTRIEAAQRDQQAMLGTLFQTIALNQLSVLPSTSAQKSQLLTQPKTQPTSSQPPLKKPKLETEPEPSKAELFQKQLRALMQTYHDLPQDDRAETVRKAVKGSSSEEIDQLSEVVDCLMLEGLKREIGTNVDTGSPYAGLSDFAIPNDEPGMGSLESFCEDFLSPVLYQEADKPTPRSQVPLPLKRSRTPVSSSSVVVGVAPCDVNNTVCAISPSPSSSTSPKQTQEIPSAGRSRRSVKEKYNPCIKIKQEKTDN